MKKLLVDGHNLIPKIPGLRLDDINDEQKLAAILQEYCRLSRSRVELFFDGAPPGLPATRGAGWVTIHNVRKGRSADDAIIAFLERLRKAAGNFSVVSSDHRVQSQARTLGAAIMTSEEFSAELARMVSNPGNNQENRDVSISNEEIQYWLEKFQQKKNP